MTVDTKDILQRLREPFNADDIAWRPGNVTKDMTKAQALAYIDARDVMERLDSVAGALWQCRYTELRAIARQPVPEEQGGQQQKGRTKRSPSIIICSIGIFLEGQWVWKENGSGDSDFEPEKGALSGAFKRAAVLWGIGRELYAFPTPWVAINQYKQIEPAELTRLHRIAEDTIAKVKSNPLVRAPLPEEGPAEARRPAPAQQQPQEAQQAAPRPAEEAGAIEALAKSHVAAIKAAGDWPTIVAALDAGRRDLARAGGKARIVDLEKVFAARVIASFKSCDQVTAHDLYSVSTNARVTSPELVAGIRKAYTSALEALRSQA